MAARKTIQQKQIEALTKKHLDEIGLIVSKAAALKSRVLTGDLRDSQNFRVRPYNLLTLTQNFYGKGLYLRGQNSGDKNALAVAVREHVPAGIKILVKDMIDLIKSPLKK